LPSGVVLSVAIGIHTVPRYLFRFRVDLCIFVVAVSCSPSIAIVIRMDTGIHRHSVERLHFGAPAEAKAEKEYGCRAPP
jgi:hypothetical protein